MQFLVRFIVVATLSLGIVGCASNPMTMQSVVEPGQVKPLQRMLIVANGDLFPDATKTAFFVPTVESVKAMLAEYGVASWSIELKGNALNPFDQVASYAKMLDAQHVLFLTVANVSSYGPRNVPVENKQQPRLISGYGYSFAIAEIATRRNIWKGELRSGSDYSGNDNEVRQVQEKLREHLVRTGLLTNARKSGPQAQAEKQN
ncbi:MAG: hypothetical protein QG616_2472 [Pseudomonadota bacterium]|jgi:hypothetical protein|nr:hypothetical protein [Pseudomonadota bacterium]MDQ5882638.1 hypothetical protein [Pseudomonadota bacterium]MDQ5905475.1 hypothetical protein [Pseudomonadota bacterium]MDQ5914920.1 hypothetical protein [Pseudomonadota bacterium]MDQ5919013.1 hypothetical protein [Pseudomonadota bacterium]